MRQSQNLIASLLLLAAFAGLVAGTATALSIHVPGDYASIGLALQHGSCNILSVNSLRPRHSPC